MGTNSQQTDSEKEKECKKMIIGNINFPEAKEGDLFQVVELPMDRLTDYITIYEIVQPNNYLVVEANYDTNRIIAGDNHIVEDLHFSEKGVEFLSPQQSKEVRLRNI